MLKPHGKSPRAPDTRPQTGPPREDCSRTPGTREGSRAPGVASPFRCSLPARPCASTQPLSLGFLDGEMGPAALSYPSPPKPRTPAGRGWPRSTPRSFARPRASPRRSLCSDRCPLREGRSSPLTKRMPEPPLLETIPVPRLSSHPLVLSRPPACASPEAVCIPCPSPAADPHPRGLEANYP